jgi:hypothetical protein
MIILPTYSEHKSKQLMINQELGGREREERIGLKQRQRGARV